MVSGMVYLHAVMLLHYAGREINEDNIRSVLQAAGVNDYEEAYIKAIVNAVSKVNLEQIIEQAKQAPAIVAAPTAPTPAEEKEVTPKESPKEEEKKKKKEEKKEEEALAGLAALFG